MFATVAYAYREKFKKAVFSHFGNVPLLMLLMLSQFYTNSCGIAKINTYDNSTTNQSDSDSEDDNGCQQIECLPPILAPKLMKHYIGMKQPPLVFPQNYPRLVERNGHAKFCLCFAGNRKVSFDLSFCGNQTPDYVVFYWDGDEFVPTFGQDKNCSYGKGTKKSAAGIITNEIFYGSVYYRHRQYISIKAKAIFNDTEIAQNGHFHSFLF